jgi:hypothetical protein
MGSGDSFPGVERPGREADHSPLPSTEVKNAWSYTSTPSILLHGVVLSLKQSTGTTLPLPYHHHHHHLVQWVPGALSLGVKRPGREADYSPPSSAEVKNA